MISSVIERFMNPSVNERIMNSLVNEHFMNSSIHAPRHVYPELLSIIYLN